MPYLKTVLLLSLWLFSLCSANSFAVVKAKPELKNYSPVGYMRPPLAGGVPVWGAGAALIAANDMSGARQSLARF